MPRLRHFFLTALLLLPSQAFALCDAPSPKHEFEFLGGYSPQSPTLIGTAGNRKFIMAGIAYSRVCWTSRNVDIAYTATLLPVALVLQPALPNARSASPAVIPRHTVYGLGALPLGFSFRFGHDAIQPFVDMHGGIIASAEPVPLDAPDATGLNFVFDFGAGLRFKTGDRSAISGGYKFLHISNAYTTGFNPGLDNNVIFASFSILR